MTFKPAQPRTRKRRPMDDFQDRLNGLFDDYDPQALVDERNRFAGKYFDVGDPGNYRFRMLPPAKGHTLPWSAIHRHWVRFPNEGLEIVNCPRVAPVASMRGRCYVCEWQAKMRERGNPIDLKTADSLDLSISAFAEVIDRKAEAVGPKIWRINVTCLNQLMALIDDKERLGFDFSHPLKGIDLMLSVTKEKNKRNSYVLGPVRDKAGPMARSKKAVIEWLESRPGLSGEMTYEGYEETKERIQAAAQGHRVQRSRDFAIPADQVMGELGAAASGSNGKSNGASQHVDIPDSDEDFPEVTETKEPSDEMYIPTGDDDDIPF